MDDSESARDPLPVDNGTTGNEIAGTIDSGSGPLQPVNAEPSMASEGSSSTVPETVVASVPEVEATPTLVPAPASTGSTTEPTTTLDPAPTNTSSTIETTTVLDPTLTSTSSTIEPTTVLDPTLTSTGSTTEPTTVLDPAPTGTRSISEPAPALYPAPTGTGSTAEPVPAFDPAPTGTGSATERQVSEPNPSESMPATTSDLPSEQSGEVVETTQIETPKVDEPAPSKDVQSTHEQSTEQANNVPVPSEEVTTNVKTASDSTVKEFAAANAVENQTQVPSNGSNEESVKLEATTVSPAGPRPSETLNDKVPVALESAETSNDKVPLNSATIEASTDAVPVTLESAETSNETVPVPQALSTTDAAQVPETTNAQSNEMAPAVQIEAVAETGPLPSQAVEPDVVKAINVNESVLRKQKQPAVQQVKVSSVSVTQNLGQENFNNPTTASDVLKNIDISANGQTEAPKPTVLEQLQTPLPDLPSGLPLDHPLLKSAQDQLYAQLKQLDHQLDLELKEKSESLRRETAHREKVGIELYRLQHQLVKFQQHYEKLEKQYQEAQEERTKEEVMVKEGSEKQEYSLKELDLSEKNLLSQKTELNKISLALRQLQLHKKELDSTLSVTRRVASKTDQDLFEEELKKQQQDFFVDNLTRQLTALEEEIALCDYRISLQHGESKKIQEILRDATTEMEAIAFEKRQLLHHWRSALSALEHRDRVLRTLEKSIREESDVATTLTMEERGLRESIRNAIEENESQLAFFSKLDMEIKYREKQIEKLEQMKDQMIESLSLLNQTLEESELEADKLEQKRKSRERQVQGLERMLHKVKMELQKRQLAIIDEIQQQAGLKKQATGVQRDGQRVQKLIYEQEELHAKLLNDIVHQEMELENVKIRKADLLDSIRSLDQQIDDEQRRIVYHETDLRKQSEEIGRKQTEIDLLNRKHDYLVAQYEAQYGEAVGNVGPLEATISRLGKEIREKEKELVELEQQWLKTQNELVQINGDMEVVREQLTDARLRNAVLLRKKKSLNSQIEQEDMNIKQLQRDMTQLRRDMSKVNRILSKHDQTQQRLEENGLDLESEFRSRLKKAQLENVRIQDLIEKTNTDKQNAMEDLIAAEHHIMLWERKIELAKETQAALDPLTNGDEIKQMEREIHRMKLHQANLKRQQQRLVTEMEKAIERHGEISLTALQMESGSKRLTGQRQLERTLIELRRQFKSMAAHLEELSRELVSLQDYQRQIEEKFENMRRELAIVQQVNSQQQQELSNKHGEKHAKTQQVILYQHQAKRFEELRDGKYKKAMPNSAKAPEILENYKSKHAKLREIVDHLANQAEADANQKQAFIESGVSLIAEI